MSPRQKKLAIEIVKNLKLDKPKGIVSLVESVGYSKASAEKKSSEIVNSPGVQNELERMGFTEYNAKKVVTEIMNNPKAKDDSRLKASEMVFKVHGSYAAEKSITLNLDVTAESSEEIQNMADILLQNDKRLLTTGQPSGRTLPDSLDKEAQDKE